MLPNCANRVRDFRQQRMGARYQSLPRSQLSRAVGQWGSRCSRSTASGQPHNWSVRWSRPFPPCTFSIQSCSLFFGTVCQFCLRHFKFIFLSLEFSIFTRLWPSILFHYFWFTHPAGPSLSERLEYLKDSCYGSAEFRSIFFYYLFDHYVSTVSFVLLLGQSFPFFSPMITTFGISLLIAFHLSTQESSLGSYQTHLVSTFARQCFSNWEVIVFQFQETFPGPNYIPWRVLIIFYLGFLPLPTPW